MIYLFLFIISIVPRIINLGFDVINTDALFWKENTYNFLGLLFRQRFSDMAVTHHPGVTLMWLGAVATKLYRGGYFLLNKVAAPDTNNIFLMQHFWQKLPIAVVSSLFVLLVYWSVQKLFENKNAALISALLVSLEPLFIAHSRVYNTDALLTSFMVGSVLLFLVYLKDLKTRRPSDVKSERAKRFNLSNPSDLWREKYLIFSAILGGLALLTKSNALFIIPFIPFILVLHFLIYKGQIKKYLLVLVIWYVVLSATFVAVWPSMWTNPKDTINLYFGGITLEGQERPNRHLFFGTQTFDPGPSFYPAVFLFRTSPFTFIFSILGLIWILKEYKGIRKEFKFVLLSLLLFFFLYLLELTIPAKKLDRYMLPNFIVAGILGGYGISHIIKKEIYIRGFYLSLLLFALYFSFSYHPDELAYFSPLVGGFEKGQILTDAWWWGQGYKKAADYLNDKDDARNIKVALFDFRSFKPFFNGTTLDAGNEKEFILADYFVASIKDREGFKLESTVDIAGVPYLGVFKRK